MTVQRRLTGLRAMFAEAIALLVAVHISIAAHAQPRLPHLREATQLGSRVGVHLTQFAAFPPQGGLPVSFASPQPEEGSLSIPAVLYKPAGVAKGAVVVVNSTPGWSDYREGHYGRSLSSAGYAVLAIDTYGPREVVEVELDGAKVSTHAQVLDAFAARRYLISIGYASDRMAIMGTGRGGTIALLAADRTFLQKERTRFSVAMSISADCLFQPREPKPGSRIFVAIGEKDEIAGVEPCRNLAKSYVDAGGSATVKLYPAPSGFDGHPAVVTTFRDPLMEIMAHCSVRVEPDGRSTYAGKTFAESDTKGLVAEMRKSCIKRGGAGWTSVTQKANLTLDLIEFLDANFRF